MLRMPSDLPEAGTVRGGPVRVPDADRRAALDSLRSSAQVIGARLVVVQPLYAIDHSQDTLLRDWCAENHQLYIETSDIRQRLGRDLPQWFLPDGVHPRPRGHRLIAERIAERLP